MNKIERIVVGLALVVAIFLGIDESPSVGGNFNPVVVDFAQGISVNGTQVISSAGEFIRAITGTSATFSSTLSVTGATTLATTTIANQLGVGTTTPTGQLQVASPISNGTTTVVVGRGGQSKGSCLVLYDQAGTVRYASILTNGTAFTIGSTDCR